jgi:phage-related protein
MSSAGDKIDKFSSNTDSMVSKVSSGFGKLLGAAAALGAAVGIGKFFGSTIEEAAEAQASLSQLDAVLKSTGGAAGVTADSITSMASQLQKITTFSDDAIISGDNLLLTFTNIGKDVFPDATKAMLDMSQALGQDVSSSAIQLGKALNDPVKGITALSRVGVSFTEEQKATIQSMVEMGDTAGAQKLILAELSREFGGSAEAAGKTFAGSLKIVKNQIGELKESIGGELLPSVSSIITSFSGLLAGSTSAKEFGATVGKVVSDLSNKISDALPDIVDIGLNIITSLIDGMIENLPKITEGAMQIVNSLTNAILVLLPKFLEIGLQMLTQIMLGIANALPSLIPQIVQVVAQMVQILIENIPLLMDAGLKILKGLVEGIIEAIPVLVEAIPKIIDSLISTLLSNLPLIINAGLQLFVALVEALPEIITSIVDVIPKIIDSIIAAVIEALPLIIQAGIDLFVALVKALPEIIIAIVKAIPKIIDSIINALIEAMPLLIESGIQLFVAIIKNLPAIIAGIIKVIPEIIKAITDSLGSYFSKMADAGLNLIKGLWQGIKDAGAWLWGKISGFFGGILDNIKSFFGISSPSTVMAEIGYYMDKGLANGLTKNSGIIDDAIDGISKKFSDADFNASAVITASTAVGAFRPLAGAGTVTNTSTSVSNEGMFNGAIFNVRSDSDIKLIARELFNLQSGTQRAGGVA